MIRLIVAIFVLVPKIIYWYFSWILNYSIKKDKIPFEQRFAKVQYACIQVIKYLNIKIDVYGLEKFNVNDENKYVIMCNHQSMVDPLIFIALASRPMSFVAKKEVMKYPFVGRVLKILDGKTLDRSDLKSQVKTILEIEKSLKNNEIDWLIFPEGKRQKSPYNGILEIHHGTFKIILNTSKDLYVCNLFGTFRPLQFLRYQNIKSLVQLNIDQKLTKNDYKEFKSTDFANYVTNIMSDVYNEQKEVDIKKYKVKIKKEKKELKKSS